MDQNNLNSITGPHDVHKCICVKTSRVKGKTHGLRSVQQSPKMLPMLTGHKPGRLQIK